MRLNSDCIRNILITVESIEYDTAYSMSELCNKLPAYPEDDQRTSLTTIASSSSMQDFLMPQQ